MPALLFVGLSLIRNAVPTVPIDQTDILGDKLPVTVGVGKNEAHVWCNSTDCDNWIDYKVRPLMVYADYADHLHPEPADYEISYDVRGG